MTKPRMKLNGVATLVADSDPHASTLIQQMLRGFGMDDITVVASGEEARTALESKVFDLFIVESDLPDSNAAELLSFIRHSKPPMEFLPTIVVSAYSNMRNVTVARDSGANTVVRKPISPQILYDHIAWSSSAIRPFVEVKAYIGPDRRFKFVGPPQGVGRRNDDLSAEIGDATEPNMSQNEIDALIRPTKIFAG